MLKHARLTAFKIWFLARLLTYLVVLARFLQYTSWSALKREKNPLNYECVMILTKLSKNYQVLKKACFTYITKIQPNFTLSNFINSKFYPGKFKNTLNVKRSYCSKTVLSACLRGYTFFWDFIKYVFVSIRTFVFLFVH